MDKNLNKENKDNDLQNEFQYIAENNFDDSVSNISKSISQDDYNWDYEKYKEKDKASKEKSYKNKGTMVFVSVLGSLIFVPILAFGGIKISHLLSDISSKSSNSLDTDDFEIKISSDETLTAKNDSDEKTTTLSSSYYDRSAVNIAKKVIPSVVSVVPYIRQQSFYQTGIVEAGNASGIIISDNGYIATNAHAVLQTSSEVVDAIKVILHNDKEYEAKIIGVDFNTDLAVIKIDANNLPAAELGNSNLLEVGEPAFAIGSPSGLEFAGSMTAGIISALNRTLDTSSTLGSDNKYIQTDTAINGGNSGGALVNIKGQIIGINARKVSGVGVEGMGFAIPITEATPILNDLIKYGYVKGRVKLGIVVAKEIDEFISKLNNIETGLLINSVDSNPDLITRGIKQYDILHQINNIKISSVKGLKDELKKYKPGDNVNLVFYRYDNFGNNKQKLEVSVNLIEDKGIIVNNKNK